MSEWGHGQHVCPSLTSLLNDDSLVDGGCQTAKSFFCGFGIG